MRTSLRPWAFFFVAVFLSSLPISASANIWTDQRRQVFWFVDLLQPYIDTHPNPEQYWLPIPATELSNSLISFDGNSGFMARDDEGYANFSIHTGNGFGSYPPKLETGQIRMNFSTPIEEGLLGFFIAPDFPDPYYDNQRYMWLSITHQPKVSIELFGLDGNSMGSYEHVFTSPQNSHAYLPLIGNGPFTGLVLTYTDGIGMVRYGQSVDCNWGPIPGCIYYDSETLLPGHIRDLAYIPGIPEPETYLMLLAGLGLLGFLGRQQKALSRS